MYVVLILFVYFYLSNPLLFQLFNLMKKAIGHYQFQSSDHTIDGRIKQWDNTICLTFQDNVDKEHLNGLYNELTNSMNENITKDNINASVKKTFVISLLTVLKRPSTLIKIKVKI